MSPRTRTPRTTSRTPRRLALLLATVLLLAIPAMALAGHFTDVPAGHTHEEGIDYLEDTGITLGCTPTQFCPNDNLTRAQMGTFLYRSSGHDPATDPSVHAASVDGVERVTSQNTAGAGSTSSTASVACPSGKLAVGGGGSATIGWFLKDSQPSADLSAWSVTHRRAAGDPVPADENTTVYAVCVPATE